MPDSPSAPAPRDAPGPPDVGLSRRQRLALERWFREAYDQNRKFAGRFMVVWLRSGEGAALRLGVVSSRKVGRAVARNRARRRLREVFRRERPLLGGAVDVVIVARASIAAASWPELVADFRGIMARAGLAAPASPESTESGATGSGNGPERGPIG